MIKLVFCLRRRPQLTREEFQTYWLNTHGPIVRERAKAIGALRYVQVHTSHDDFNDLLRAGRKGPEAYDGVAELWFADRAALEQALSSTAGAKAGAELLADERNFVDLERSPLWIGEEHEVVPG
ncbi:MAG: hypothetical protein ACI8TX_001216 [Hyphomicrobiaceae bacterium]|jgi:uncharacterized protein (TIGR02118 family)